MKVLQIVKTDIGAVWAFDQAKALSDRGIDIVTVLPNLNGKTANKYIQNNMPVVEADLSLPIKCPWKFFSRIKKFRNIVKEINPDIIHCHFVTNILMARIALRNCEIPRLFQVPGPLHLESFIFRKIDILSSQKQDFWMGACRHTVDIYKKNSIPENKLFLGYYGGYGGEKCEEYAKENNIIHKDFNIDSNKIIIGMVSYIYKPKWYACQKRGIKGHEDFIDALEIVRKSHPNVVGVIIGEAWGDSQKYFEKIKKYAADNCKANIVFTGYRNDIKEIYCELDIVVHPSHSENLGGAAESLAAARPTISTDVGGFPDIVINDKTGILVPKKQPEALAKAILKMISNYDNAKIMALEGQNKVRELLDINVCADCVSKAYKKILGE